MPDNDERDPRSNGAPESEEEAAEGTDTESGEELTDYWDAILGPRPEAIKDRLIRELGVTHPGVLTIASSTGRVIVQIDPNGKVKLGPGIQPDEAAEEFWTALALKRRGMEERLLHIGMMEALLIRVGRADVAYETAALRARVEGATEEDRYRQEMARRSLEALVHQMIEFSRGLLERPDAPPLTGTADTEHVH